MDSIYGGVSNVFKWWTISWAAGFLSVFINSLNGSEPRRDLVPEIYGYMVLKFMKCVSYF